MTNAKKANKSKPKNDEQSKTMKTCSDATKIPNLKREGPPLPSIQELLLKGADGEKGKDKKPKTVWQTFKEPILLAAVFAVSLFIFHHVVMTKPRSRPPFVLPQHKPEFKAKYGRK